jgi:hypothetical protein
VAAIVAFAPNQNAAPEKFSNTPAVEPVKPKTVPLSKEASAVAKQFVLTAVARRNLDVAWKLAGPNMRGTLTHKQWMTGNIPVVPYPVNAHTFAPYKIDYSFKDAALIEIALLPPKGQNIKPQAFFLRLEKVGKGANAHWIVNNWVPRSSPPIPRGENG